MAGLVQQVLRGRAPGTRAQSHRRALGSKGGGEGEERWVRWAWVLCSARGGRDSARRLVLAGVSLW